MDFIVHDFFADEKIGWNDIFVFDPIEEWFIDRGFGGEFFDGQTGSGSDQSDVGIQVPDADDEMVFKIGQFFKEVLIAEPAVHDKHGLGAVWVQEGGYFEELESQKGVDAFVTAPADLAVAVTEMEEADRPPFDGEGGGENKEAHFGFLLIGRCFCGGPQITVGDEAGIEEDGDELFVIEPGK